ncbi:MAG: hypothetical protein HZR80_06995 [Candidatus Heimdallarchaeota archaeon]
MSCKAKQKFFLAYSFGLLLLFLPFFTAQSCKISTPWISVNSIMGEDNFRDFFVDEPIIYATRDSKFYALNSSDLKQLVILGEQESPESWRIFLLMHNEFLFLIRNEHYFGEDPEDIDYVEIVDISNPLNPILISEVKLPSSYTIDGHNLYSHGVISTNNKLYVFMQTDDNDYFLCINCTNIVQPELLEYTNFPGEAGDYYNEFQRFYIRENVIFIPSKNNSHLGFVAYNFTSVQSLTKVCEWFGETNLSTVDSIYASQEYVYLKSDEKSIEVFAIQNLTAPIRKGYIDLDLGDCFKTFFRGNYLFVFFNIFGNSTLNIYDYTNITNLLITSSYLHLGDDSGFNHHFFIESMISPTRIYIPISMASQWNETLYILDWSNPYDLELVAILGFPIQTTNGFPIISISSIILVAVCIVFTIKLKYKRKEKS